MWQMARKTHPERLRCGVEAEKRRVLQIGRFLHAHPEPGFKEFLAAQHIVDYLGDLGFDVEVPYAGFQTAFRAVMRGKGRGPAVGVLAEYDALAQIGHACGHNLISVAALTAAAGMAGCRDHWPGTFEIIGTPAEELLAGKCAMAERGAFDHLDVSFMTHPSNESSIATGSNALRSFTATFRGRAAHAAAAPEEGINALDAAVQFFNSVHAMRQHLREDARVHSIITDGGQVLNVIPERAVIRVGVRARDEAYQAEIEQRVVRACRAAARALGAGVSIRWDRHGYRPFRINAALDRILVEAYGQAGISLRQDGAKACRGSLDMGNVSQIVPASHPFFSIFPSNRKPQGLHTRQFARQANMPHAYRQAIKAGTGMALAAARLLTDRSAASAVKKDFGKPL